MDELCSVPSPTDETTTCGRPAGHGDRSDTAAFSDKTNRKHMTYSEDGGIKQIWSDHAEG